MSSISSSPSLNSNQGFPSFSNPESIGSSLSNSSGSLLSSTTESRGSETQSLISSSDVDFRSASYNFAKQLFLRALNNYDFQTCLKIISAHESKISELLKLRNDKNMNLLHLLADQIIKDQNNGKLSSLKDKPFELLSKVSIEERIYLINVKDDFDFSLLDLAVFCKLEKFNFVHQILKLIPKEYRASCYEDINENDYYELLKKENLDVLLGCFYLSKNKFYILKITNKKIMNLLHMLLVQIIKKNNKYIDELIKVLKKIPADKRKDIVMTKTDSGKSILHLAALVKDNNYTLLFKILGLIPEKDRAICLKTKDYLKEFAILHQIAFLTTNENDLSNEIINKILSLVPEEDRKDVEDVKDLLGRTFREIQQLKKERDEIEKLRLIDRDKYLHDREVFWLKEIGLHNNEIPKGSNFLRYNEQNSDEDEDFIEEPEPDNFFEKISKRDMSI